MWSFMFLLASFICFCLSWFFLSSSVVVFWKLMVLKNILNMKFSLNMDWVSMVFLSCLFCMVFCVIQFSMYYMAADVKILRFIYMILAFVVSMVLLVLIPDFMFLLVGWDGLGFTSFLLVMYYSSFSSWSSGLKTYMINRLGDGFLVVGVVCFFNQGHWLILGFDSEFLAWLLFVIILGFFTKSAQFPFSSWLPAAMAAPTPVSSLVHSSTLVTAGVYLLIRFSYVFGGTMKNIISVVGVWTLFSASFAACVEWDVKKIIAFSTLSQLGLMCFCLGLGLSLFSFFHLITHAVFKAMLFISVGVLIGHNFHFQDIRSLKTIKVSNPLVVVCFEVGLMTLSGCPFLSGFFSKDFMMEKKLMFGNFLFEVVFLVSLSFTVLYSFRLYTHLFLSCNVNHIYVKSGKSFNFSCLVPLVLLSIFFGEIVASKYILEVFPSLSIKVFMLFLIIFGVIMYFWNVGIKSSVFWYCSTVKFMEPLKSLFFVDKFSNVGEIFYNIDQSAIFKCENFVKSTMLLSGAITQSFFFFFVNRKMGSMITGLMVCFICWWA